MNTTRKHTESNTDHPSTGRNRLTVVLSAALLLLTVLSSIVVSTAATAAPVFPDELVEVPQPDALTARVIFGCDHDNTGATVYASVVNNTTNQNLSYSWEVQGPNVSFANPAEGGSLIEVAPGETSQNAHYAGKNGDLVDVWVRDAQDQTLAHVQWTVDCGLPEPTIDLDVVCTHHDPYVIVTLGNDGTAPVSLDVFFFLASLQKVAMLPESRTVNPGEPQSIEYVAERGETYAVEVLIQDEVLAEDTVTIDCYDEPTPPDPTPPPANPADTPPRATVVAPRFTG